MDVKNFDLIVIGAGPGGYVAALSAARQGMKVAVCEKQTVGGTCLGRGCIPTKTMLHTAEIYKNAREGAAIGVIAPDIRVDMNALQDYKNQTVSTLSAPRLLIATGSSPVKLPLPGMDLPGVMDSDLILDNREPLESLTIIGGGVIGMEFACLYASLGTRVTVIEALDRILATLDKEFGQNLKMILKKQDVDIHTSAMLKGIREEKDENGKRTLVCTYEEKGKTQEASSEKVLVAVGRRALTQGLFEGLENIPAMDRGRVLVNENYETNVPGIYAIGDVIGGIQLAHVASAEGENAVAHMLGKKPPMRTDVVPSCVYTEPEIASVGLTVEEAREKGIDAEQLRFVMSANGKTVLTRQPRSFLRIVCEKSTGKILGAQMMCARATDMIGEFSAAIVAGITAGEIAPAIRPHPTFNEAVGEALRTWTEE